MQHYRSVHIIVIAAHVANIGIGRTKFWPGLTNYLAEMG